MKKRVLVQDSEEPDPETGELNWVEEKEDDEDTGEEEKIYIGKVSFSSGRPLIKSLLTCRIHPARRSIGADHAPISILHPRQPLGKGHVRIERMSVRQGRLLRHQRLRKGIDRARTNGHESSLRLREIATFTRVVPGRNPKCRREGRKDDLEHADQDDEADRATGTSLFAPNCVTCGLPSYRFLLPCSLVKRSSRRYPTFEPTFPS